MAIRTTSGTSGSSPLVFVRKVTDHNAIVPMRQVKNLLVIFGSMNHRLNQVVGALYLSKTVEHIIAVDNADFAPGLERVLDDFRPDGIRGSASQIMRMSEHIIDANILSRIKVINFSGEFLSRGNQQFLHGKMPQATMFQRYAASEVGTIGENICGHLPINSYHPNSDVIIEISKTDHNGIGDILVSKPRSSILRYRIGDCGRLIQTPCPCGNPVTFEVLGRTGFDFIKLVGTLLRQEEFDRVAAELSRYMKEYRGEVREEIMHGKVYGKIHLRVVPTEYLFQSPAPEQFLSRMFSERVFLTPTQTLGQLIEKKFFLPMEIIFVKGFPPQNKNIKLRLTSE